jgi:hypothetical protein
VSGKSFQFGAMAGTGTETLTATLDPEEVQRWLTSPAQNHGIRLDVDVGDHHVAMVPPQSPVVGERPLLTVTYALGTAADAGTESPPDVGGPQTPDSPRPWSCASGGTLPLHALAFLALVALLRRPT